MEQNILAPTSEVDKYKDDGVWFINNGLHVAAQYDRQYYRAAGHLTPYIAGQNNWGYPGGSPIAAIWQYYSYYNVVQNNNAYGFAATDYDNNPLPQGSTWQRGQKIRQLVKDLAGNLMGSLEYATIDTRSVTPAAANRKTKILEMATLYKDLEPLFKKLEEKAVAFSPMGGKEEEFESLEQAQEFVKFNYKEKMEIEASQILEDIKARNDYVNTFYRVLLDALIGGVVAIQPIVKAGKVWWKVYDGTQIIYDNSIDSQHHRKDQQFMGVVRYMTAAEALMVYGDEMKASEKGREMYEKIENLSIDNYTSLGTIPNSTLPCAQRDGFTIRLTIIDTWWMAAKDTRYVERTNKEYGSQYVAKLKKDIKEDGNYWWDTWYKTTLIGNLGQVRYGEEENLVENYEDKKIVEPPLVIWTPDLIMGYAQSLVGHMTQNQDVIDYYKNKITDMARRSTGKNFVLFANKLGKKTVVDIMNDFQRYGGTVLEIGDGDMPDDNNISKLAQYVDLTIDPNIAAYDALIKNEEELMKWAASASDISLGQQSGYLSLNSQMTTISQNEKGIFGLKVGFMRTIIQVFQLSVNIQKNIIADHNDDYGIPMVSEQGQVYLKATKELALEDMQIYMKFMDNITKEARDKLINIAERFASDPNSGITMEDVGKMNTFKTMTELVSYFSDVAKKTAQRKTQAEQMIAELQQEIQNMKNQAAMNQTLVREQAATERNDANNETALTQTMLKEKAV